MPSYDADPESFDAEAEAAIVDACTRFEAMIAIQSTSDFLSKVATNELTVRAIALFNAFIELTETEEFDLISLLMAGAMIEERFGIRLLLQASHGPRRSTTEYVYELLKRISRRIANAEPTIEFIDLPDKDQIH